jgi:hypothetical protein
MKRAILDISFEYPDVYTKKNRSYTGKATIQDEIKGVYVAYDFKDEKDQPPINFSTLIYIHAVKSKGKDDTITWASSDPVKKDLLQAIGKGIQNAIASKA